MTGDALGESEVRMQLHFPISYDIVIFSRPYLMRQACVRRLSVGKVLWLNGASYSKSCD